MFKPITFILTLKVVLCLSNPFLNLLHLCNKEEVIYQECATKEANRLMKIFANGVENYVPNLTPYKFAHVVYANDFVIELFNGTLSGLGEFEATKVNLVWNDKKVACDGLVKRLELQSNCKINGNILDKHLNGNGTINIVMDNVVLYSNIFITFTKRDKQKYVKDFLNQIHLMPEKVKFTFTGSFGEAVKDKEFNDLLNQNPKESKQELLPIVEAVIQQLYAIMQHNFVDNIPFEDFFLK